MIKSTVAALCLIAGTGSLVMAQAPSTAPESRRPAPSSTQARAAVFDPDNQLASKLIGTPIKNDADEVLGSVSDLVLDREGKVKKVIASIGGFLSIGARNVGMSFNELKPVSDGTGGMFLKANYTRDQLKAVPEWQAPGAAR